MPYVFNYHIWSVLDSEPFLLRTMKALFPCFPEPSVAKQFDVTLIGLIWILLLPRSFKDLLCNLSVYKISIKFPRILSMYPTWLWKGLTNESLENLICIYWIIFLHLSCFSPSLLLELLLIRFGPLELSPCISLSFL